MRKIVVRDLPYRWALTPGDDGLRVVVRGERRGGGKLFVWFGHDVLVTPYVVCQAIERGLEAGWDPTNTLDAGVRFDEPVADRPMAIAPPPAIGQRELALLERIADTDGDDARLVYADWLLERGDPQGELIALACLARPLAPAEAARRAELELLRDAWLGPVAAVAQQRTWEHGMLATCALGRSTSGVVDAAVGHRAWRTVRSLDARGRYLAAPDLVRLVAQPALHVVRELAVTMPVALELAFVPFEHPRVVRFAAMAGRGKPTPAMLAALAARLPALEELVLPALPMGQLRELVVASAARTLVTRDLEPLRHLDQLDDLPLTELVCAPWWYGFADPGPALSVRRGADGAWSSLAIVWEGHDNPQVRTSLVAALATVRADLLIEVLVDRSKPPFDHRRAVAALELALAAQPRARLGAPRPARGISPGPTDDSPRG